MDLPSFPFKDIELEKAGLSGNGVSNFAAQVVATMKEHPELLNLSLFALKCINLKGHPRKLPSSPRSPGTPTLSASSAPGANICKYGPDGYERTSYYNGITRDGDHPELVYRSDYSTTPFPKPTDKHGYSPVKSLRGVFDTPLNSVWDIVGPQIRDLIKARGIHWSSIDPARFFTHGPPGEKENGSLGPVVIWAGVVPGSTSSEAAHDVSQVILALLRKNGVEDTVVEWREAVSLRLKGPPLLRCASDSNATHYFRRFLTALLGVPLATEEMEEEDSQGTLTLWFHENKDKYGNPSDKVYGVSNCHVLRKNTTVDYEHRGGAPRNHVRVCGVHRFQRGLDEITEAIANHGIIAHLWAREIVGLEAKESQDAENARQILENRHKLDKEKETIIGLETLYDEVCKYWSKISFDRDIGHVQYAAAVSVDVEGGTMYTSDWAVFLATEAKVKAGFEGNVVDLGGSKYSSSELTDIFYPRSDVPTTFKFPKDGKFRIERCATKGDLANPTELDSDGIHCLMVGKDGNSTDLTVGRYAGLVSYVHEEIGIESVELGIYSWNPKTEVFADKGDSGSLVWSSKDGKGYMVGQIHGGSKRGGLSSNHVTYCTPAWFLLEQIRKKFKYADFYHTTW